VGIRDQVVKFARALVKRQDWTTPGPLLQRIRGRACVYLGLPSSATCEVRQIAPCLGGRKAVTRLFKLEAGGLFRKIFVKTYLAEGKDGRASQRMQQRYQTQVEALEALGQAFVNETEYKMPLLLDAWEDLNTVVIEGVDGVPAIEAMRGIVNELGMREGEGKVRDVFRQSGAWLAHLHNVTYAGEEGIDPKSVVRLQKRLQQGLSGTRLLGTRVGERVIGCGRKLGERVEAAREILRVPIARCHGDFWVGNLMLDAAGAIWGVDPYANRLEPVYIDLTHFLGSLRTERKALWPDRVMRRCERSFLTGYVRGARFKLVGRREGLRICRIYSYLRLLAQFLERRGNLRRYGWTRLLVGEWVRVKYLQPLETMILNMEKRTPSSPGSEPTRTTTSASHSGLKMYEQGWTPCCAGQLDHESLLKELFLHEGLSEAS